MGPLRLELSPTKRGGRTNSVQFW